MHLDAHLHIHKCNSGMSGETQAQFMIFMSFYTKQINNKVNQDKSHKLNM